MKINTYETHDRLLQYKKQQEGIGQGVEDCIKNVPDAITSPFYVYGHTKTVAFDEKKSILSLGHDEAPDSRLIWMPTITKPKAAPNTYLFLCKKNSDVIEIIWMLPKFELWQEYAPGKMMHNQSIWISIESYLYHRDQLNAPDKEGPTEKDVEAWIIVNGQEAHKRKAERAMQET